VTGIDPSRSLIESATRRAAERSLDATFLEGTAAAMPLPDASADVIVSVFGVIFAPDAEAAAREMARVAAPVSRIVLAAWHPYGALADVSGMRREALAAALGAPPASPPLFVWDDESSVRELFEPFGFAVSIAEANLAFTASTVDAFAETEFRNHPAWLEAERVLDAPALATLLGRVTQLFIDANEDPDAFRLTSDYAIVTLRRT
jgi:SAM-dependent methyltransferase